MTTEDTVRVVRTVEPSATALSILTALLDAARCQCGALAERLTVERVPHTADDWRTGRKVRKVAPTVVVLSWCGSVSRHTDDMTGGSLDRLAMTEDDC